MSAIPFVRSRLFQLHDTLRHPLLVHDRIYRRHLIDPTPHASPQTQIPPNTSHTQPSLTLVRNELLHHSAGSSDPIVVPLNQLRNDGALVRGTESLSRDGNRAAWPMNNSGKMTRAQVSGRQLHHSEVRVAQCELNKAACGGLRCLEHQHK